MRIEVIVDDKSLDRFEFICQPRPGEVIEHESGTLEVKELRHNLKKNRLEAWCTKRSPTSTDRPLSGKHKGQQPQTDQT